MKSSSTKADFEARIAAENVDPTKDGGCNVQELKDDTVWLSDVAGIDEVSALRVVILELQDRASARILQRFTAEEKISLKQAMGNADFGRFNGGSSAAENSSTLFDSSASRQARLLKISLLERECLLGVKVLVAASQLTAPLPPNGRSYGDLSLKKPTLPWLQEVAKRLSHRGRLDPKSKVPPKLSDLIAQTVSPDKSIEENTKEVSQRLQAYERGSGWAIEGSPELEEVYLASQLAQTVSLLELVSIQLGTSTGPEAHATMKVWFQFVDDHGFFASFKPPSPQQQKFVETIQVLLSVISLQIIKLPRSMDYLRDREHETHTPTPAILDLSCQKIINTCLLRAADHGVAIASPVMLAWSILLQQLRVETSLQQHDKGSEEDLSFIEDAPASLSPPSKGSSKISPKAYVDALQLILDTPLEEDPIQYLAKAAVNVCQVFSVVAGLTRLLRNIFDQAMLSTALLHGSVALLELIRVGLLVTSYSPDVLDCTLAILSGSSRQTTTSSDVPSVQEELGSIFIHDADVLTPGLYLTAQSRYPYEFAPYLKLNKALSALQTFDEDGNSTFQVLSNVPRCSQVLPRDFIGYELVREDENANSIRLTEDLPLFAEKRTRDFGMAIAQVSHALAVVRGSESQDESRIPRGTTGFVVNDKKPFVVTWEYPHSTLKYLSRVLSTATITSPFTIVGELDTSANDLQSDIIELIAIKLFNVLDPRLNGQPALDRIAAAHEILEEASDSLGRNQDIVTLVSTIFEEELSRQAQQRTEGTTALLVSCVHFIHAIVDIVPGRAWPLLARSDFVQIDGNDPKLVSIVAAIEIPTGRFDLLLSTVALFEALIKDIITNAVQRKSPKTTNGRRFAEDTSTSTGLSEKVLSKVVFTLTRIFLDVLSSSQDWTFVDESQRIETNTAILQIFDNIVTHVYGFDDEKDISKKLTSTLAPAAKHLVDAFVSTNTDAVSLKAVLQTCIGCTTSDTKWIIAHNSPISLRPAQIPLRLLTTLLHVTALIDTPSTLFEQHIFRFLPIIIRIYAADQPSRNDAILLITALVNCAARTTEEPPSLLSQLGQENSKNFLTIISNTNDTPLGDNDLADNIWNLCTTLVSGRQQWFATYLLTGDTPRASLKGESKDQGETAHPKPLLSIALDALAKIKSIRSKADKAHTIAMLQFIAAAQSLWPWVTDTIRKHPSFIRSITDFVDNPKTLMSEAAVDANIVSADQRHTASLIADILAIFLYNCRHMGDLSSVKVIASKLSFFKEQGVAIPTYSSSLHVHLKKNFSQKFPGCEVGSFKRVFGSSSFGRDYFYDLEFAARLLGKQPAWSSAKDGSFADEFVRANTNLSLVQSQVLLLNSWKTLAIELSANLTQESSLQKQLATIAQDCLIANAESNLPEIIFDQLLVKRADLALIILQRLVAAKSSASNVKELLGATWNTIRACGHDLDSAFAGPTTEHYRILLKILLLGIQFHAFPPTPTAAKVNNKPTSKAAELPAQTASILLELVTNVVAKGFCSLATLLHEGPQNVLPSDISLLTAIFQSILRIPAIEPLLSLVALRLSDSNATRYAVALFSWSDRFTAEEDDPIYGELSVAFLAEMSNIPSMAEFLAAEGLLAQLSSATIMGYFRHGGGMGPFDSPPRMHAIWSRLLLPLCLNMLVAVGESFAAEVTAFLGNFPEQLGRVGESLDAGHVVLNAAAELHNLALLSMILERFRTSPTAALLGEVPELKWDRAGVKSDLESYLGGRRAALRERIVPLGEQELVLSRLEPTAVGKAGGCENRLEERVIAELQGALRCLGVLSGA